MWMHQPESLRRKNTEDISTFLLRAVLALIFIARRIQPSVSLVDREVKFLCTHEKIVLHLLGML